MMRRPATVSTLKTAALTFGIALAACVPGAAPAPSARVTAPASGTLVVMGTTDVHGWLLPYDYYTGRETANGLARLVPTIDSIRAANPGRTVLLDSGDLLQGNPLDFVASAADTAQTHPVALAMNRIGYDAAAVGNHEFNYGVPLLRRVARQARFSFVAANIFRAGTDTPAFTPYVLLDRQVAGRMVRVGVTGVTAPGVMIWDRDNVRGRIEVREIVSSTRAVVREMRARGADLVVIAAHSGLEGSSYDTTATGVAAENAVAALAREVPGIDLILMGHTHGEVADTTIGSTLVVQPKNWAASLGVAEFDLTNTGDGWRVAGKRGRIVRPAPTAISAPLVTLLAEADARTRAYVSRRIGTSTAEWSTRTARVEDTPLLDLVNDVQRRATGADLSATAAFTLDARLPAGPVTVADVAGLYIYDNTLKALRISGAQLRAFLEKSAEYYLPCPGGACARLVNPAVPGYNFDVVSGVDYEIDLTRPVGARVTRLERNGRPVAPADSFTIALNNYRASGSGGYSMLLGAPTVYDRGEAIRDLLIRDIERRGTISPADVFRRNWRLVPDSLARRALAEQLTERRR